MSKLKRIYHNHEKWEDFKNGMYQELKDSEHEFRINESVLLLVSEEMLYKAMKQIIENWIISSEVILSNVNYNRRAWLGQSACNYSHKATESETREAWNQLSDEQRLRANNIADIVIKEWEEKHLGGN